MNLIMQKAVGKKPILVPVSISLEEEMDALSEGQKGQGEILVDLQEADRAMDVAAALEDLAFVASTMQEVSPKEAALIQIVADTSVAGSGLSGDVVAPAMEEETSGSSIAAGVKAAVKRIVDTIFKVIDSIVQSVKEYVMNFGKTAGNAAERVKKLGERFEKFEGRVDGSVKIKVPAIAHYKNAAQMAGDLAKLIDFAETAMTEMRTYVNALSEACVRVIRASGDEKEVQSAIQRLVDVSRKSIGPKSRQIETDRVRTKYESSVLFADVVFYQSCDSSPDSFDASFAPLRMASVVASTSFGFRGKIAGEGDGVEIDALNGKEIEVLLKSLARLAGHLNTNDSKSLMSQAESSANESKLAGKDITDAIQAMQGASSDAKSAPEAKAYAEAALRVVKHDMTLSTRPYIELSAIFLRATNIGLRYINASLDAYEAAYKEKVTSGKPVTA